MGNRKLITNATNARAMMTGTRFLALFLLAAVASAGIFPGSSDDVVCPGAPTINGVLQSCGCNDMCSFLFAGDKDLCACPEASQPFGGCCGGFLGRLYLTIINLLWEFFGIFEPLVG